MKSRWWAPGPGEIPHVIGEAGIVFSEDDASALERGLRA